MTKELIWCQRFCNADPYRIRNVPACYPCYFLTGCICDWSGNHGDQKSARPTMLTNLSAFWPINTMFTFIREGGWWPLISEWAWLWVFVLWNTNWFLLLLFVDNNNNLLKCMYLLEQIALSIHKIRIDELQFEN